MSEEEAFAHFAAHGPDDDSDGDGNDKKEDVDDALLWTGPGVFRVHGSSGAGRKPHLSPVYDAAGRQTHVLVQLWTPGVRSHYWFLANERGQPSGRCEVKMTRAWQPPSELWFFAPREETHTGGSWYCEVARPRLNSSSAAAAGDSGGDGEGGEDGDRDSSSSSSSSSRLGRNETFGALDICAEEAEFVRDQLIHEQRQSQIRRARGDDLELFHGPNGAAALALQEERTRMLWEMEAESMRRRREMGCVDPRVSLLVAGYRSIDMAVIGK